MGNERFWVGVTLSDEPAPDTLFTVAGYQISDEGTALGTSPVIDPHVRSDFADALEAIADGSDAPTARYGWLTLEGFGDEPASDVDFAFDLLKEETVLNAEHKDADEGTLDAIRSACALLARALRNSLDKG